MNPRILAALGVVAGSWVAGKFVSDSVYKKQQAQVDRQKENLDISKNTFNVVCDNYMKIDPNKPDASETKEILEQKAKCEERLIKNEAELDQSSKKLNQHHFFRKNVGYEITLNGIKETLSFKK